MKITVAGGVGGLAVGVLGGALATPKGALPWIGLAAAPPFGFGALLLPGLFEGHWQGIGIWWLGAATTLAFGMASCWITHRVRHRP